jgi:1-acyl-sn-glycerol-3-phosphate acyltransferase
VKRAALNIYIWPVFVIVTSISLLILPVLLLLNLIIFHNPQAQFIRQLIRIHGWVIVKLVPFMAPCELDDRSGELDLPVIFVANHCSSIDPYLFGLLPYENAFITSWPFRIPIFNKIMPMAEYIHSEDGWDKISKQSEQLLKKGCSIIVWPEGHRSPDGYVKRFKKGAFQIAKQTGVPIVPVCITGSRELLPPGKKILSPSRVKITVLSPIKQDIIDSKDDVALLLRDKARNAIEKELLKSFPFASEEHV